MYQDYELQTVRSSAILTGSYVAGTIIDSADGNGCTNYNQLIIYPNFTIGSLTSLEIKIEYAPRIQYTLAYDGQTANFTAGATIRGDTSGVTATIVSDADSGATGTLTISPPRPSSTRPGITAFIDNETIRDDNGTPGVAVVNGAIALADTNWYQETASAIAGGISTESQLVHQFIASGRYVIAVPIKHRFIRISAKGTGTTTSSLLSIEAALGVV